MTPAEAWELLGVAPTDDARTAKRAYAARLKEIDVDADPEGFIRLRDALETAQRWGTGSDDEEEWDGRDWDGEDWQPGEGDADEENDADPAPYVASHFRFDPIGGGFTYLGGRPAVPMVDDAALEDIAARIDRMLFDEEAPDAAAIGAEGRALLKSREMESVDAAVAIETWLAEAIVAAMPRSDPLAVPAINHFGWRAPSSSWKRPAAVDAVLERYDDRVWLAGPAADAHAVPLRELSGTPRARSGWLGLGLFELGKARAVARFLDVVRREHPSVEQDLKPANVAWWDRYLAGRRPPGIFWSLVLAVPPVLLPLFLAIVFGTEPAPLSGAALFSLYGACVAATLLLIAADAELRFRLRNRDDSSFAPVRPSDWGWALLLLALPLAAATIPAHPVNAALFWTIALAAGLWGLWRGRNPYGVAASGRMQRLRIPITAGLLAIFIAARLTPVDGWQIAGPLAALCFMGAAGYDSAAAWGEDIPGKTWMWGAGALLAAHVAAVAALIALLPAAPLAATLPIPALLMAQHWLLAGRYAAIGRIEYGVRLAAVALYFTHWSWSGGVISLGAIAALSAYGLGFGAASLFVALRHETRG